jgi:alpha-L-rhamnosidase
MKVTAGPNAGLTYREFATKRLAELIADPAQSNNGNGPKAGTGGFSGGQASNKPYTITTGFNGTPNLLPALTRNGDAETAYKLFSNDEYASWLYPVTLGATSMWELWNSYELAFQQGGNSRMNSYNHFALGASASWMYEYQMGITTDGAKGYRDFVLQPTPGGEFTSLKGSFDSVYGEINSGWTAAEGKLTSYSTTVPANTSATLYLPVSGEISGFENIPGVTYTGMGERNGQTTAVFTVAAGAYEFAIDGSTVTAKLVGDYVVPASVTAQVTQRTLAGKVYLSVAATNNAEEPADIVITTEFGKKKFNKVASGKTVSAAINTRATSVPAGEATVTSTLTVGDEPVTETVTVPFAAFPAAG